MVELAKREVKVQFNFWLCLPESDEDAASLLKLAILGKAKECYFDELQAALKARPGALAKI